MFRTLGEVQLTSAAPAPAPPQPSTEFYEEAAAFVLDVTLTSNEEKREQGVFIDGDGDFVCQSIAATQTGNFSIRLKSPNGRYFPQEYAKHSNIVGAGAFPMPIEPPFVFPSGARIACDVKDTSGAGNTLQIVFKGVKRYRVR